MKGNYFLEIHPETGALLTQGKVLKRIDNDHWLVVFAGKIPHNQVVPSKNMVSMNLFDSEQHMDAWIKANRVEPVGPPAQEPRPPKKNVLKITDADLEEDLPEEGDVNVDLPHYLGADDLPIG